VNIPEFSIRRPVTTTLLMVGLLLFGWMAYRSLPVSDLPNVDFPVISVSASLPGANPETMASSVATPLEKQFSTIAGIDTMTSTSSLGRTEITIQFTLDRDIDAAAQDVAAAIAAVQRQLPPDMPSPPTYRKVNPADQPILFVSLVSPTLPLSTLDEYAETLMAQRISMVNGVSQVMVYGAQKYAVRVRLDPTALAARGIGIDEVANAIDAANVNLPTGTLYGEERAYTVRAEGQLMEARRYGPIIVAYRNGNPVRLQEIGTVLDSVENDKTAAWYVRERAIVLAIQKQPGTNTVRVADEVKQLLPTFRSQLPASVSMNILYDSSEPIRDSVQDVKFTLVLSLCLVVLVIFLFLRNLRATIIPSLALPMSIIGTFAAMYLFGFSVDNLSLMALTLSVGFVVDDAIVMLENIVRHLEMGKGVYEASVEGSNEVGFTIISMTLSLAAVFIPILFMGGIVGRLFREFAVTIAVAILLSGFISLTLTPMLCSRLLRRVGEVHHGRLFALSEKVFNGMLYLYDITLRAALRAHVLTMLIALATLVATGYLFMKIPKGFIPSEDRGRVMGSTEAAEGASFLSMVRHQKEVAEIVASHPAVDSFMSSAGGRGGQGAVNTGFLFIRLKPKEERKTSIDDVIQDLRRRVGSVPGVRVYLQNPPTIQIGARMSAAQYQYTLQSPDTDELYRYAPILESQIRALPGFLDVTSDLRIKNPEVRVEIDRDKASALGVTAAQIESSLYNAYGSRQISSIYAPSNTYNVVLEVLPEYQSSPSLLSLLYVRSSSGKLVPLDALVKLRHSVGPLSINHSGQLPSVTISFNLQPGVPLGDAVAAVEKLARQTLPATISTSFQGTAQAFKSSLAGMGLLLLMAIAVIYMVLGILYESFIHPITILSGLPSAAIGAILTLLLFHMDLNLYGFVGIIMLIGIVKKNGIMMIDFALESQRKEKRPPREAIHEACLIRFRPIMMTTVAAIMAGLPIAFGYGAGGEARQPLGLTVVGGLLFSQLITLYVTPVFFVYMDWIARKLSPKPAEVEQPPA